jgi:GNAT superfamily N-acetyltransferase
MNIGTTIVIRPWQPNDAHAVSELFYQTVRTVNTKDYAPEQIEAWAPSIYEDSYWLSRWEKLKAYVATINETVVGFAELGEDGEVDCFYVHAEHQGEGIGSALLKHIETIAKKMKVHRLWADVSVTAEPFFSSKGFIVVHYQRKEYRGQVFDQALMEKHLN